MSNPTLPNEVTMAEGTVITVALDRVVADPSAWPRHRLDTGRVAEFAELYREDSPSVLPPLDVVPGDAGEDGLILADGWHRLHALRHLKVSQTHVRIIRGEPGEAARTTAYRHGLDVSATVGLPLTRTERAGAVRRLLTEQPEWADRMIARRVGVSPSTVAKYRNGEVSKLDADERESEEQTAERAARTLVRGFARLDDQRGLLDMFSAGRTARKMGAALADALDTECADDAIRRARAWREWLDIAITELEESE